MIDFFSMNRIISIALLSLIFTSCNNEVFKAESRNQFIMGTVCIITLYGNESDSIFEGAFSIIEEQDRLMSMQDPDSELSRLNKLAGKEPLLISANTYDVIERALNYARLSDGAFDPTIAPLVELWGIGQDFSGSVPDKSEIVEKASLTDYNQVRLNEDGSVFLEKEGMKIDLGGIAKGYIADLVKEYLLAQGVTRGIINLGGNIIVIGSKPEEQPWKIGIQDPFDDRGRYIGIAEAIDKTIVTSGIYERFFYSEGTRYHHILDPETGYPVDNDLASVTIISEKSIDADALSTSLFVLGVKEGMALIESSTGAEAVFVTKDKKVLYSSGASEFFKLDHSDYNEIPLSEYP